MTVLARGTMARPGGTRGSVAGRAETMAGISSYLACTRVTRSA